MTERSLRSSNAVGQCRICLDNQDPDTFITPCDCRGSMQFVHLNCLQEYFEHRYKNCSGAQRRRMKQSIKCEICHSNIRCLKVSPIKRCVNCEQLCERVEGEDIFFMVVYLVLYLGFHAVGIVLLLQDELMSRIIGGFWLLISIVIFNYGLYRIIKEVCYIREAKVNYQSQR